MSKTTSRTTAVILAAGRGSRMKSNRPKALHPLGNRPMIRHLVETARQVFDDVVVVIGRDMPELEQIVRSCGCASVVQEEPLGTGHAARAACAQFGEGDVAVFYADNPLVTAQTMERLLTTRREKAAALCLLGMRPSDPGRYGRIVVEDGQVRRIVEFKDATEAERRIALCNAGMICAPAGRLRHWLAQVTPDNAQGEYYLTDVVAQAAEDGPVLCIEAPEDELAGINSRAELARAEAVLQQRLRARHMENGVTFVAPETVFLSSDTQIAADVVVEPHVIFGPGVNIASDCLIRAFSHLEGCRVERGAVIGPYARLRPGTLCAAQSHVGNFVELKNAHLGEGAKANHLSYLGDARIGAKTNIGAGTITCNYDGVFKHRTVIGARSFIGSDSILIAPVTIGDDALVAAGSVITKDVPAAAMAFGRAPQKEKPGKGLEFKQKLQARKEKG